MFEFFNALWNFIIISAPYLILGLIIGGIINAFINVETMKKMLSGKDFKSVVKAAIFGVPLPLCSCAVIPTAVSLKKSGASNAATSSFLISTPESGVDSIVMTYGLMDLPMTIIRPVAAFVSAFFAGILQIFFNKENENLYTGEQEEKSSPHQSTCGCHCGCSEEKQISIFQKAKNAIYFAFGNLLNDISFWLIIGIVSGAVIDYFVPDNWLNNANGLQGRLIILLIGIPFYICASASTPIAASLIMKGLSPGAALLFLLVGPATNISNIFVMQKFLGKKGVFLNIFAIAFVALVFSFIVDFLYQYFNWPLNFQIGSIHSEHHHVSWFEQIMGVFLVVLLLKGLYIDKISPYIKRKFHNEKHHDDHHHNHGNGHGCCGGH